MDIFAPLPQIPPPMRKLIFTLFISIYSIFLPAFSQQNYFNGKSASLILGQLDSTSNVSASVVLDSIRTHEASGVAVSAKGMLAVSNHGSTTGRVMLWNQIPSSNGTPANIVIGKPNFSTTNSQGGQIGNHRIRNGSDVCFSPDGSKMIVADENNHRVLIWNKIPTSNGAPADVVVGQPDFTSNSFGTGNRQLNRPNRVLVSADGRLLIVDQANNRVLVFNQIPQTNFDSADVVIGQANFISGSPGTGANRLNTPTGISISPAGRLYISEAGGTSNANYPQFNNRILIFDSIPQINNQSARSVLGNSSLNGPALYADNPNTLSRETSSSLFNTPRGIDFSYTGKMAIADERSHRALIYQQTPITNQAAAQVVLGLPALNTSVPSTGFFSSTPGTPSGSNMASPYDLTFDPYERLLVAGSGSSAQGFMNRLMVFGNLPSSSADIGTRIQAINDSLCDSGTSQFLVKIFNNGPSASGRISATAGMPPFFTLNRHLTIGGGTYNTISGQLVIDSLGVGDTVSLFLEGTLRSGSRIPDTLYTYAGINGLSHTDPNMNNNGDLARFKLNPLFPRAIDTIIGVRQLCQGQNTILYVNRELFPTQYRWTVINGTFSVIPNGVGDSIRITGSSDSVVIVSVTKVDPACSRTLPSIVLRLTPLPSTGAIQLPQGICAGIPGVFRATGVSNASHYRWTLNGQLVSQGPSDSLSLAISQSPSTLVVRPFNQACSRDSMSRNITFSPRAVGGSITGSDTVCFNSSNQFRLTGARNTTQSVWTVSGAVASGADSSRTITASNTDFSVRVLLFNGNCPGDTLNRTIRAVGSFPASISISSQSSFCSANPVLVTATTANGGSSRSINWFRNGSLLPAPVSPDSLILSNAANRDTIRAVMTSSLSCASPNPATSNAVVLNIINSVVPSITITADSLNLCGNDSVTVSASVTGGGASPSLLWQSGTRTFTGSGPFRFAPSGTTDSLIVTMSSSAACANPATVVSNRLRFTANPRVTPSINLIPDQSTYCQGSQATVVAQTSNRGTGTIQWFKNGNPILPNPADTLRYIPNNNDNLSAVLTTTLRCATAAQITSSSLSLTVNQTVVPNISITADSTNLCGNDSITLRALISNGGSNPIINWQLAGQNLTGTGPIRFKANNSGDSVKAILISSEFCATPQTDTSNVLYFTHHPRTTLSASLQIPSNILCTGDSARFSVAGTGLGNSPIYSWVLNNVPLANSSASYIIPNPQTNDSLFVLIQSSDLCASPRYSRTATQSIQVVNQLSPSAVISASDTALCSGEQVLFTAATQNAGTNPIFNWYVNGSRAGGNSDSLLLSSPNTNDQISVVLQSSLRCVDNDSVSSNSITLQVNNTLNPSINIQTDNDTICAGNSILLTATVNDAGSNYDIVWYDNGQLIGNDSSLIYTPSANNLIRAVVRTNSICTSSDSVSSTASIISVYPSTTPTISIQTDTTGICEGAAVLLTSVFTESGSNPAYQWFINGQTAGNQASLQTSNISNGDQVSLIGVSNALCTLTDSAFSNVISFTVAAVDPPSAFILLSDSSVCPGSSAYAKVVVTASSSNQSFSWSVNQNSVGGNVDSILISNIQNETEISVQLSGSGVCPGSPVTLGPLSITLNPEPTSASIEEGSGFLYVSNPEPGVEYIWSKDGSLVPGGTNDTLYIDNTALPSVYNVLAINNDGCSATSEYNYSGASDGYCNFAAYPNPFSSFLTIESDIRVAERAMIYDQNGLLLKEYIITQCPLQLETSWLAPGMYTLKIIHSQGHSSFKVVKIK